MTDLDVRVGVLPGFQDAFAVNSPHAAPLA